MMKRTAVAAVGVLSLLLTPFVGAQHFPTFGGESGNVSGTAGAIAGGGACQVPYQSATGVTAFTSDLCWTNSTKILSATSSLSAGTGVQWTPILSSPTISGISGGGTVFGVYSEVKDQSTNDNSANTSHIAGGEFVVTEQNTLNRTVKYGLIGRVNSISRNAVSGLNIYGGAMKVFGAYPGGLGTNNTFIGLDIGICVSGDINCTSAPVSTGTIIDLFIEASTGAATHYGIYSPDQGVKHFFGGKMGFGTLAPLAGRLHLGAGSQAPVFGAPGLIISENGASYFELHDASANAEVLGYVDTNGGVVGTTSAHSFSLYTSLAPRLVVGATGNVGIPGAIPAASLLDVRGTVQFGTGVNPSSFTATGQGKVFGTATNDSAAAGYIGEVMSVNLSGTQTPAATTTYVAISTVTFTAGDWDLTGLCQLTAGATTAATEYDCGISTSNTSMDSSAANNVCGNGGALTVSVNSFCDMGPRRVSLSGSTTYYLVAALKFSTLGGAVWGTASRLQGRRMR